MKWYSFVLAILMAPGLVLAQSDAATTTAPAAKAADSQGAAATATADSSAKKQDMAEQSGFSKGSVVRSVFTHEIKDREPTDNVDAIGDEQVFYFTELRDMNGQTAIHRWQHNGKVMAEIKFDVRGNRWRVWSSKNFIPETAGEWTVSVLNGAGEVISEDKLVVSADAAGTATGAAATGGAGAATGTQNAPAAGGGGQQ